MLLGGTYRQQDDLISLLLFFKNKERRLKICVKTFLYITFVISFPDVVRIHSLGCRAACYLKTLKIYCAVLFVADNHVKSLFVGLSLHPLPLADYARLDFFLFLRFIAHDLLTPCSDSHMKRVRFEAGISLDQRFVQWTGHLK
jgi:hypothetical protein